MTRAKRDWDSVWTAILIRTADPRRSVRMLVLALSALPLVGLLRSAVWITATGPNSPLAQGDERLYLPLVLDEWTVLCNGGFEAGKLSCWEQSGQLDQSVQLEEKAEGRYAALLGNPSYRCRDGVPVGEARIAQTFAVPSCIDPTLSFKYRILSYDRLKGEEYDSFDVYVGRTLVLRAGNESSEASCDADVWDSGWQDFSYLLNRHSDLVEVSFHNVSRKDRAYNTWTYIDHVEVECPPPLSPREAVLRLIEQERTAVLTEDLELIKAIFSPDAPKTDAAVPQTWPAIARYAETFQIEDHTEIGHANYVVEIDGDTATVTNDSRGSLTLTNTGKVISYDSLQSDRWTFERDPYGRWRITSMTYNLKPAWIQYGFEDGTDGFWAVRFYEGTPQGQAPKPTTARAHQGSGSLRFDFDLAALPQRRAQVIRYNVPFAGQASAYLYAPPTAPTDLEAGFFAMELDHDPWNYHEPTHMTRLARGTWTKIEWNVDASGWARPLHLLGIEVRQAGTSNYIGYVLIDDVSIKSQ